MSHALMTKPNAPELLDRLAGVKKNSTGWQAKCPAHDDGHASLTVSRGEGKTLLYCHAGCPTEAILDALGMSMADLFDAKPDHKPEISKTYNYRSADGEVIYQVVRMVPKDFRQRRPDGNGGWIWNLSGVERVLYHLPQLLAAVAAGEIVFIVEGERDVATLERLGLVATTNAGGAGKWLPSYTETLRGASVVIVPDNDGPGRAHGEQVAQSLQGVAVSVKVIHLPGLPAKGDVSDYIAMEHTAEDLRAMVYDAPEWSPGLVEIPRAAKSEPEWPSPMAPEAFQGLAGDVVRLIEPHSEADPVALLLNFMTAFGNVIGDTAHFRAEADRHPGRLFVNVVGETSKGRKGASWGHIRRLFEMVCPEWKGERTGLTSGEGLIWEVRDPIEKDEPVRDKNKKIVEYQTVISDSGVDDKRILDIEPEFVSVLRVMARTGNTLSAIIRSAWDTGVLRTMVKNNPATATGAHVSIIGHITKDELLRYLDSTEAANGLANRFLWACVKRSKLLPEGGNLTTADLEPLVGYVQRAVAAASTRKEMKRDPAARVLWADVYPKLSEGLPGMLGAVTGRAEAQTMRLALIYALLDCSGVIYERHLMSALAVWDYCFASARYIFGKALGDSIADEIARLVKDKPQGVTRNEIYLHFGKHESRERLGSAIDRLQELGQVRTATETTGGRPVERVFPL